jgi:hypothetical protein
VLSSRVRVAMLLSASALALMCLPAAQAAATEVEASQITSPADPSFTLDNQTLSGGGASITIAGTTTGGGEVDIRCYYSVTYTTVTSKVPVVSQAFSVSVEPKSIPKRPCVLRAVPTGFASPLPTPDPFQGPRIAGSKLEVTTNESTKLVDDYALISNTLAADLEYFSAGQCGLQSLLYAPTSFAQSSFLFYCNAAFYAEDGAETAADLQVDGANAFAPAAARYLEGTLNEEKIKKGGSAGPYAGAAPLSMTQTFDEKTGMATVHETDPIVKCAPATTYPPTAATCSNFVSAGVQLERSWQATDENHIALMTDTWRSTDGAPHGLSARYYQEFVNAKAPGGAYEFPGTSTFVPALKGQQQALPAGTGPVFYKTLSTAPEVGDGETPQGAIVYDSAPTEPLTFYHGTNETNYNWFEMPYQHTIPAGGSYTLRMGFVQGYGLPEVRSLAEGVQAGYLPSVAISAPGNGTVTASPTVTVSGTASDGVGLSSLTVNGQAVSVAANGTWSTTVALSTGANTITATATNASGLTKSSAVTVTYVPVSASRVGSISGAKGHVTVTLSCQGPAGASCAVNLALTTVERKRGGHLIAVVARRTHIKSKRVTIGSLKATIAAGQTVKLTIKLNSTGRKLLAHFGRLPASLSAVLVGTGTQATIATGKVTIKPAPKRRRRRH